MDESQDKTQLELKEYLEEHKIHELFTKIVEELLKSRPENPMQTIADYLHSEYGVSAASGEPDTPQAPKEVIEQYDEDEEDDDDDDYDEDEVTDIKSFPKADRTTSRRVSVSAGVLDMNALANAPAPVFEKTEEQTASINKILQENTLFRQVDPESLGTIVKAMEQCSFNAGDIVIKEGDTVAEHFFILSSGTAEALKGETVVKSYEVGEGFGELALLYNQPRAATVKATSEMSAWRLDQMTFKKIIVGGVMQKREKYTAFLAKCPYMKELNDFETMTLADSLVQRSFKKGDTIITQGDVGKDFFILEAGVLDCVKEGKSVKELHAGDYFGEIALLYDQPRQASVVVSSGDASVLAIDRKTFQKLLGPLGAILKRDPLHQDFI